jgi:hypothetical protein
MLPTGRAGKSTATKTLTSKAAAPKPRCTPKSAAESSPTPESTADSAPMSHSATTKTSRDQRGVGTGNDGHSRNNQH